MVLYPITLAHPATLGRTASNSPTRATSSARQLKVVPVMLSCTKISPTLSRPRATNCATLADEPVPHGERSMALSPGAVGLSHQVAHAHQVVGFQAIEPGVALLRLDDDVVVAAVANTVLVWVILALLARCTMYRRRCRCTWRDGCLARQQLLELLTG